MAVSVHTRGRRRSSFASAHPTAFGGVVLVALLLIASFVLPLPYDPTATDPLNSLQPPSLAHWFGTDSTGGDVLSRVVAAAKVDLLLALMGTVCAMVIGVPLGLLAGTHGRIGVAVIRGVDVFQAFPLVILALTLVSLSGNQLYMVVVAVAIINAPRYVRLIRSEVLAVRERRFVEAAEAIGATTAQKLFKHILPNVLGAVLAQTSLTIANAIVVIATLSFLGVGVGPPTPSWGSMIRIGSANMTSGEWWLSGFPGLAVVLCVLAFNQLSDALTDYVARSSR